MIHLEDNPTCQHQEFLEGDEYFASGPYCEKPARWLACDPMDSPVCDEHKCRCKIPIRTRVDYAILKLENAKNRFNLAGEELDKAIKEMNEIIKQVKK